jgi:putative ABC transport system permease protein
MSLWTRIANAFRADRLNRELDEEFESHIAEAIEAGRDPEEARRAFGSRLRQREASREFRVAGWLDGLRADAIFGWRQLKRNKVTSAVAVLSLALAMGACVSAFRLVDALLLRPLPVSHPERLYALSRQVFDEHGVSRSSDSWAYPSFARMKAAAKPEATLIAASKTDRLDLTYATDEEMEKGYVQYVSGWTFESFGLRPALGPLLTEQDDRTPGAHPYAVISYDYWKQRFGRDPHVIGRTFHLGEQVFEIVGVGPQSFTGIEPGTVTDIFLPTMMHRSVTRSDSTWHRTLAVVEPGTPLEPLRAKLDAISRNFEWERSKEWKGISQQEINLFLNQKLLIEPAASGVSNMQEDYRSALAWLGVLVGLVLLIACANVANLMTALTAARAREMALRVSIGAGRMRLAQMVLVESAMLAVGAALLGMAFAWWSAPLVVRLILPADWRVFGFGIVLIAGVLLLFGLLPALRASAVKPIDALKGGDDPHARRRWMHAMIAAQVAFCFVVVFVAGLFVTTFHRLAKRPIGFDASRLLLLEAVAPHGKQPEAWVQMAETIRSVPGVQDVAESGWPLLSTGSWNGEISVNGSAPSQDWGYFLAVSPGWVETMKMPLVAGRDFRSSDTFPGAAIVNETFVKQFLKSSNPVGMTIEKVNPEGSHQRCTIVGVVAYAPYRYVREPILPVAFVPYRELDEKGIVEAEYGGTFLVRTKEDNPMTLAQELRRKVAQAAAGFRVSNVQTQQELLDAQTVRERLLAMLGVFFAGVALLLAGIGLYGVLHYSVLQRRREIGIRIALGARRARVAQLVSAEVFRMVLAGGVVGWALGMGSARYLESLLYQVKAGEPEMAALPPLAILVVALVATAPAVLRALRIDPAEILRSE